MDFSDTSDTLPPLVIVVDDDPTSMDLLTETLKAQGYRVHTAACGQDAIDAVAASNPDLILLDVVMPDLSGYDVCHHLKKSRHSRSIPVIFISGLDETVDKVKGFEAGGVDYITKPIHLEELLARAKTHIDLHRLTIRFEQTNKEIKNLVAQRTEELAHANIALGESEQRYRNIFVNSPVSLWVVDFSKVKDFLDAMKPSPPWGLESYLQDHPEITRQCVERIEILSINQSTLDLFEADNQNELIDRFKETFTTELYQALNGIMVAFRKGASIMETDASLKTLRGKTRDIILRVQIASDQESSLSRVLVSVLDISDRKQAEEALRESESRYRLVMDASPDPIVVYDMEGKALYVNPAFTRVFGWTFEEVAGKKIDYVPEAVQAETRAMLKRLQRGESCFGFETQRYDKNRRIIDINMSFGVWRNHSGKPAGSVIILRDVTKQQQLEKQLRQAQKMESIGTLAGGIAHDFNNILAAIIGYSELSLALEADNTILIRYLQKILQSGNRAKELVHQILSFSRTTEAGKSNVCLTPIIKEALKLLRATIPTTIEIYEHLNVKIDRVFGNPTQIHQILMNLCTNANFAMRQNGGTLEIKLENINLVSETSVGHTRLPPNKYIKLIVSDTGHGISSNYIDRIFDPYFTTKSKKEGTGMGLSIVHGIVKDHAGAISVESEIGKGTTFEIYLPVFTQEKPAEQEAVPTIHRGSGNILLVDDEKNLVDAYGIMMESLGYKVTGMVGSREALELFCRQPGRFDLVLTDYTMPHMTGIQLATHILEIRPDIPIILYSGYTAEITLQQVKDLGLQTMIKKPLNKSKLSEVLDHYL